MRLIAFLGYRCWRKIPPIFLQTPYILGQMLGSTRSLCGLPCSTECFLEEPAAAPSFEKLSHWSPTHVLWQRVVSHLNYSLNSLKGAYIVDYIGGTIGATSGDTRSLDYSSFRVSTSVRGSQEAL